MVSGYDAMEETEDCYIYYNSHGQEMIIPKEEKEWKYDRYIFRDSDILLRVVYRFLEKEKRQKK